MKLSEIVKYKDVINAAMESRIIQLREINGEWTDLDPEIEISFRYPPENYRVKPEIQYRPWTFEEIPLCRAIRSKKNHGVIAVIVATCQNQGLATYNNKWYTAKEALELFEVSLDRVNWSPCGILEDAK